MPIRRVFLDWTRPPLASTVDYLLDRYRSHDRLDLGGVILAVPGGRVGRRLVELLVNRAERENLVLYSPTVVTVGRLPEHLYQAKHPFADTLVQELAWIRALKQTGTAKLQRLLPAVPADDDLTAWLGLAGVLARLHTELAAENLDFQRVAEGGRQLRGFCEERRWQALAEIQEKYLRILDGVELWDLQTARLVAIQQRECQTEAEILLVGTADLNRVQQLMLDQVAPRVTALVFAPESLASGFDAHGCLRPEAWQEADVPLRDEQIEVVGGPAAQATAVLRAIASLGRHYAAQQITVGVPDERIVSCLENQLAQCDIEARYGPGTPTSQSPPYRLLLAAAEYLETCRFAALAALVRHPAVTDWLAGREAEADWPTLLDTYYSRHFPGQPGDQWIGEEDVCQSLQRLSGEIRQLLGDLAGPRRSLDAWCQPILDLLLRVFGRQPLDSKNSSDRKILNACRQIHDVLCGDRDIPPQLVPSVTAAEAIRLVLDQLSGQRIPPLPSPGAIELLGWLELPMDDAPVLIVTSFNEGVVPSSLNADLFLPNQLRRALGIEDNSRRYARDAYALSLLCQSREKLTIIAGRRTGEGDPLVPSRLLFATDPMTAAKRALRFFSGEPPRSEPIVLPRALKPAAVSKLKVPPPRPLRRRITSMRVTEFRDYLACPYRYYLRHCLKLRCVSDCAEELDGLAFGSLVHDVLRLFGEGSLCTSTVPEKIGEFLSGALDELVRELYGSDPLPVIQVQVEQLRTRLMAFARWQADWAADGWRIEYVEREPEEGRAAIPVDGEPMLLRGRIDRIDVNQRTGVHAIFDYKSSNSPETPDKAHRNKDGWIDLQLPLYRHLAAGMGIDGPLQLGYIVLPKDTKRVQGLLAEWTEEDLREADRRAEEVIRGIRAEAFWPPATPAPAWFEEFAAICQDGQLMAAGMFEEEAIAL